jgi:hypothetical protein
VRVRSLATGLAVVLVLSMATLPVSTAAPVDRMDEAVRAAAGVVVSQSKASVPVKTDDRGRVLVYVDGDLNSVRTAVKVLGGAITDQDATKVRAAISPTALQNLAKVKGVKEIRRPDQAVELIVSEGVQPSGAQAWHGNGHKGAGVKVGIIDTGFGRLEEVQANGELPQTIVHDGQCGAEHSSSHGTTVAEIVHDMAPQAQLFLACVQDAMGFDDAAQWLKNQDVDVVNVSIGFPGTGRGDGTSAAGQSVAMLRNNGITVVAAAGNEGLQHMSGQTVDPENNGWMNIEGDAEALQFSGRGEITAELRWDAWPATNDDLDLFVVRGSDKPSGPNDTRIVARSTRPQKATPGGMTPVEMVTFTGEPHMSVFVQTHGVQPQRYDITLHGQVTGLSYTEPAGSIIEPAASPYAIAVGAIRPANAAAGSVESYSSRGPTIDGRIKPDVTGFAEVTTYSRPTATGTSVAAAHVAGAAALYKGANANLDPAELEAALLDSSTRLTRDNVLGHGVVNVGPPRLPQPPPGSGFTAPAQSRRVFDGQLRQDQTVTVRIPDLPADTQAVALNVTGTSTARTDVEVFADVPVGAPAMTLIPQKAKSVLTIATLHPVDKVVRIRNQAGDTQVQADLVGYFGLSQAMTYFPLQRATRLQQPSPTIGEGQANARALPVRGVNGVPTGAMAVSVTVTTTAAKATDVKVYGRNWPNTATFNARPGEELTYQTIVPIGDDGAIRVGSEAGAVDVTVDVNGWFAAGDGARYMPLRHAATVLSTVTGTSSHKKPFAAKETRELKVTGWPRIPGNATAVAMSLQAPRAESRSQLSIAPREWWPGTTSLTVEAAEFTCDAEPGWAPASTAMITSLGPSGTVKLRNNVSEIDARVVVNGYFTGGTAVAPEAAPIPVAHWKFDEGSGTSARDSAGSHHATMRGGAGWTDGVQGKAAWFDGGQRDAATGSSVVRTDQSFTVSAWVYLTNRNGAYLLGQDGNRASGFILEYLDRSFGDSWFFSAINADQDNSPAHRAQSRSLPAINTWMHLTGVHDAERREVRLYLDGTLVGVQGNVTTFQANGEFTIGSAKYNNSRAYLPGGVDDVRVYGSALKDNAVRDLYASYGVMPSVSMVPRGEPPNWYGWDTLDGKITGTPAVASSRTGRIDVFANGTDNKLYQRTYDGSWSAWTPIGDALASDPAVVSWGPGRFDLFARGEQDAVYHKAFDGGRWHDWVSLGGKIKFAPAVSSWGPGRLDVFAVGTNDELHHMAWDNGWHPWHSLGGGVSATPAAVSWGPNRIDIFVRGMDDTLFHMAWAGQWYPWHGLDGKLKTGPTVASWGPDRLDVFVLGMDDAVHQKAWNTNAWFGWYRIGGRLRSAPAAVSWGHPRIEMFARGITDKVCHLSYG